MVKPLWLEKEKARMDARLASLGANFAVVDYEDKKRKLAIEVAAKKRESDWVKGENDKNSELSGEKDEEDVALKAALSGGESNSLIEKGEMMSSPQMMDVAKWVAESKTSDAMERVELVKQLEAKIALETLLSAVMTTNWELMLKVDEMSIELDAARKVEARFAAVVAEMGAPISHFGNVANYAHVAKVLRHMHLHPHIGITLIGS